MRALPAGMNAVITAGNGTPDLKLELIDWAPHYAAVFSGGASGRSGAAIAADGALVQAYNDGGGHIYARRVVDPTQSAWGSWTLVGSNGRASGEICLAALSDRLRVLWQDSATTNLYYADSTNNGVSWTAGAVLFDAGAACAGIAADAVNTQVFVLYQVGAAWRVALWTNSAGWTKADWTNGDWYGVAGLGVAHNPDGSYLVAAALQQAAGTGLTLQLAVYAGGMWSPARTIVPADLGAGVTIQDAHLVIYDNLYHLSYGVSDSGAVSGLISSRAALMHSVDSVHWTDPLEDGTSYAHGAVALKHAAGYLLAAPDAAALALPYTASATQYKDCTADVNHLVVDQVDRHPATLTVPLQNESGQYTGLAPLCPNTRLRLSLGYAGLGVVCTHVGYIEEWTYERGADVNQLVIVAADARSWLARQARATLSYSGQTVDWLTREVLARARLLTVSTPATTQFSQTVATFAIPSGHTWLQALDRLANLYGYDIAARAQSNGTDSMVVVEKSPGDAAVWSYGDEVDSLRVRRSGDRANHVLVYGTPGGTLIMGEAWDAGDVASVSQERFLLAVDPEIGSRTGAGVRVSLLLTIEQRRALGGAIAAALHPGLELWGVLTAADASLGPTTARVASLRHSYDAGASVYEILVGLEGVCWLRRSARGCDATARPVAPSRVPRATAWGTTRRSSRRGPRDAGLGGTVGARCGGRCGCCRAICRRCWGA